MVLMTTFATPPALVRVYFRRWIYGCICLHVYFSLWPVEAGDVINKVSSQIRWLERQPGPVVSLCRYFLRRREQIVR